MTRTVYKPAPHHFAWQVLGLAAALLSATAAHAADTSPKQKPKIDRVLAIYVPQIESDSRADGLVWVTETARQFAADLSQDARFAELRSEYHYYFDSAPVASAAEAPSSVASSGRGGVRSR
jgi:hypothetical protein